jgi:hypothetical protein
MTYFAHWVPKQYHKKYEFIRGLERDGAPYYGQEPTPPWSSYERDGLHIPINGDRLSDIIKQAADLGAQPEKVTVNRSRYDSEITIRVIEDVPNANYAQEMERYERLKALYVEERKILAELHRIWTKYKDDFERNKKLEQLENLAEELGVRLVKG